jgi:hypothetical protein
MSNFRQTTTGRDIATAVRLRQNQICHVNLIPFPNTTRDPSPLTPGPTRREVKQ